MCTTNPNIAFLDSYAASSKNMLNLRNRRNQEFCRRAGNIKIISYVLDYFRSAYEALRFSRTFSNKWKCNTRKVGFFLQCNQRIVWYVHSNYISAPCAEYIAGTQKGHCPGDRALPIKTSSDNAVYLKRHMTLGRYCLPSLHLRAKIIMCENQRKEKNGRKWKLQVRNCMYRCS